MSTHFPPRGRADSQLLVVDVQDRLIHSMPARWLQGNIARMAKLTRAARALEIPVHVTEQAPTSLGRTMEWIRRELPDDQPYLEKQAFSCWHVPTVRAAIESAGRPHVVICGMETHICVLQTARDLLAGGYAVSVVRDAVLSRNDIDYHTGIELAAGAGALATSFETILYEWMEAAGTPAFKAISGLTRDRDD
jgi:nicotinamidase-related amidase